MDDRFEWLSDFGPCICVDGEKVDVLTEPKEFYAALSSRCKTAKDRVILASLYIGTGDMERALVTSLQDSLADNKTLRVRVLLDACRGSRGSPNSRAILLPLLSEKGVRIALYRTPMLSGWLRKLVPERWNEIFGLQHVKIYVFDNDVVMTGANLSKDYFTNRQDRCVLFRGSKQLADFCEEFVDAVSSFSHGLNPDDSLTAPEISLEDSKTCHDARKVVESMLDSWRNRSGPLSDTRVWPLVQMGQLGVDRDRKATSTLLSRASSKLQIASGYFNLTKDYEFRMISNPNASYDVLMAHPTTNGFFDAQGISGMIPHAYTFLASHFFNRITANNCSRIRLFEYLRPKWTFHGKGLWMLRENEALTFVGSPNFGYRSVERDLELQLAVVTTNVRLRKQLDRECNKLFSYGVPVTSEVFAAPERYVPYWVRLAIRTVKHFF